MSVISKNVSFAEEMKGRINSGVQSSAAISTNLQKQQDAEPAQLQPIERSDLKPSTLAAQATAATQTNTETTAASPAEAKKSDDKDEKKKRVLIGIYVTPDEQAELRQMFCSNGFSLSNAYRSAMTYLRQDIEQGKAFITKNSEILRK